MKTNAPLPFLVAPLRENKSRARNNEKLTTPLQPIRSTTGSEVVAAHSVNLPVVPPVYRAQAKANAAQARASSSAPAGVSSMGRPLQHPQASQHPAPPPIYRPQS